MRRAVVDVIGQLVPRQGVERTAIGVGQLPRPFRGLGKLGRIPLRLRLILLGHCLPQCRLRRPAVGKARLCVARLDLRICNPWWVGE